MKSLVEEGKELAKEHDVLRNKINNLKMKLDELRKEFKVMNYDEENKPPLELRKMEDSIYSDLTKAKNEFTDNCDKLRSLKSNVDFLKETVEQNTTKTAKDFDLWHAAMIKKFEFNIGNKMILKNEFNLKIDSKINSTVLKDNLSTVIPSNNGTYKINQSTVMNQTTSSSQSDAKNLIAQAKNILNKSSK